MLIALEEIKWNKPVESKCLELFKAFHGRYEVHVYAREITMTEVGEYLRMSGAQMHSPNPMVIIPREYDVVLALDDWGTVNAKGFTAEKNIRVGENASAETLLQAIEKPQEIKKSRTGSDITVVIPCRSSEDDSVTQASLKKQSIQGFKVVTVVDKDQKGANWARNQGFRKVKTEYVLFSDNDIDWRPEALEIMLETLESHPDASYAYGAYEIGENIQCNKPFDPERLKQANYISTMSLIRTKDFPGFDETIKRLQDWDLWLTMLEQGKMGVYCGAVLFSTKVRNGITHNGFTSWEEANTIVKNKHNL